MTEIAVAAGGRVKVRKQRAVADTATTAARTGVGYSADPDAARGQLEVGKVPAQDNGVPSVQEHGPPGKGVAWRHSGVGGEAV